MLHFYDFHENRQVEVERPRWSSEIMTEMSSTLVRDT